MATCDPAAGEQFGEQTEQNSGALSARNPSKNGLSPAGGRAVAGSNPVSPIGSCSAKRSEHGHGSGPRSKLAAPTSWQEVQTRDAPLTGPAREAILSLTVEGEFCFAPIRGEHWTASARDHLSNIRMRPRLALVSVAAVLRGASMGNTTILMGHADSRA